MKKYLLNMSWYFVDMARLFIILGIISTPFYVLSISLLVGFGTVFSYILAYSPTIAIVAVLFSGILVFLTKLSGILGGEQFVKS